MKYLLESNNLRTFLPATEEIRQWWDRKKRILYPLFPGYLFVNCFMDKREYYEILSTIGVVKIVGNRWPDLSRIPEYQIESVKKVLKNQLPVNILPGLSKGDIIRIKSGALKGVQGVLIRKNQKKLSLIISVDCLNRSLEVKINCKNVRIEKEGKEVTDFYENSH